MARVRPLALLALAALALLLTVSPARADRPVIEPGRESEVIALFAPLSLGAEVTPGWRLMWLRIQVTQIEVVIEGPGGAQAGLRLEHPDRGPAGAERTPSFAVSRDPTTDLEEGQRGVELLLSALRANDRGGFWHAEEGDGASRGRGPGPIRPLMGLRNWLGDGILLCFVITVVLLVVVTRQLEGVSWRLRAALAGSVIAGGLLRWWIAPEVALGAWPYSRLIWLHRRIFYGPLLAAIARALGARLHLTDVVFTTNFVLATLTPLAVFAHMRHVSRDPRVAVGSAALLAFFPNHIRFSRSEVEFIPSLLLSSLTFALLYAGLTEPRRALRWILAGLAPLALVASVATRELNILTVPLLLGGAAVLGPREVSKERRAVLAGLLFVAGVAALRGIVLRDFPSQVREGLSVTTLVSGVTSLVSMHDTLINPWITPTGVTLLAVLGAVVLWRTDRDERRQAIFLLAWLALFYFAHAYVTPKQVAMQARYHLHLAPPLVMLAASGLCALHDRRPWAGRAALAYAALAPLLHLSWERDVAFNDMREFAFVRGMRSRIPDGCTVLEYTGEGVGDSDARFERIGEILDGRGPRARLHVIPAGAPRSSPEADPLRPEARAVIDSPPECLMVYQGIPCFSAKAVTDPIARACEALEGQLRLETIGETRFPSRPYDENLAQGFGDRRDVPLVLYRVVGRK